MITTTTYKETYECTNAKKYFDILGKTVNDLWKESNYDELAFPEIAQRVLSDSPPSLHVSFWDGVQFAFLNDPLPRQPDIEASFGQPPLTVYWNERFHIELLFWVEGVPNIHQHGFSGAFHVMCGSSLHSEWTFEAQHRIATRLIIGRMTSQKTEVLRTGDTRIIIPGQAFIHATFHLDRPSVSVVIRTNQEANYYPQYGYYPPSIAFAALDMDPSIRRRGQLVNMLARSQRHDELMDILLHFFEHADAVAVFYCLFQSYSALRSEVDRNRLLAAAARRYPILVEALRPALAVKERREKIVELRRSVAIRDLQFFLSLLLNVPERESVLKLIQERYLGDPIKRIVSWVLEMSELGVLPCKWQKQWLDVLDGLIRGPCEGGVETVFAPDSYEAYSEISTEGLQAALKECWFLSPLFASGVARVGA